MAHGMASEPARRPARTGVAGTLIAATLIAGTACGAGRTDIVVAVSYTHLTLPTNREV